MDSSRLDKRLERYKQARIEAERLLEERSVELYAKNKELITLTNSLEMLVAKRTSEMQRARDEALTALQVKSDFITNMSHELRTPMNGVLGVLALLSDQQLSAEQLELVQIAESSGNHLLDVINDILDFSKIEANKIELDMAPVHVRSYFEQVCAPFALQAKQKSISFSYQVDDSVPGALILDKLRLTQIVSNLLSNAIKFTEHGSVFLSFALFEGKYRLCVSDTGIGMSEEQLNSVFIAFEQADTSITREFGGTGLGMNITKRLVEMFDGTMEVESTLNDGTLFRADMPFESADPTDAQVKVASVVDNADLSQGRILLVEDNLTNQFVAKKMLSRWDCHVDVADNGKAALSLLEQQEYRLVLMDLQMPIMGGIEATQQLRKSNHLNSHVTVIAMTAHNTPDHIKECFDAGMQGHIPKPIDRDLLQQTLQEYLAEPEVIDLTSSMDDDFSGIEIEGVDVKTSLERLGGDWPLLYSLLTRFALEYQNIQADIEALQASGEHDKASILAHRIKGGASNIGLDEVSELAAKLEWDLNTNRNWPSVDELEQLSQWVENLNANMKLVDNPSNSAVGQTLKEVSNEHILQQMHGIKNMLSQDLMAVDGLLSDLLECHLPSEVLSFVQEAQGAMNQFDTKAVTQFIDSAIEQIG